MLIQFVVQRLRTLLSSLKTELMELTAIQKNILTKVLISPKNMISENAYLNSQTKSEVLLVLIYKSPEILYAQRTAKRVCVKLRTMLLMEEGGVGETQVWTITEVLPSEVRKTN